MRVATFTRDGRTAIGVVKGNLTDRDIALFGATSIDGSVGVPTEEPRNVAVQFRFH
jgi:hypothetical protein